MLNGEQLSEGQQVQLQQLSVLPARQRLAAAHELFGADVWVAMPCGALEGARLTLKVALAICCCCADSAARKCIRGAILSPCR